MTYATDRARDLGIPIRSNSSDYRTPCPKCSPNRRKKKDPCLHVTIGRGEVKWFCFHCDWSGGASDDDSRRAEPFRKSPAARPRPLTTPARPARGW